MAFSKRACSRFRGLHLPAALLWCVSLRRGFGCVRVRVCIAKGMADGEGEHHRVAKLVLLGDQNVGKSSLVLQFVNGKFYETREPTIGGMSPARAGKGRRT